MKEKLIKALKTSYADKGFKQNELEGIAELLAKNLSDNATDEEISNAVSGAASYVNLLQKVGNRYASQIEDKYKGYVKPQPKPEPPTPTPPTPQGLTTEQVQEMLKNGIAEALKPYREAQEAKRLAGVLAQQNKLKGVPEKFVQRYKLDKEENAETLASQIEQDYAEERKAILQQMGISDVPNFGNSAPNSDDDFAKLMHDAQQALAKKD